jgi:hypothetical protein
MQDLMSLFSLAFFEDWWRPGVSGRSCSSCTGSYGGTTNSSRLPGRSCLRRLKAGTPSRSASCDVQRFLPSEPLVGIGPFTSIITGAFIGDGRNGQGEGGR